MVPNSASHHSHFGLQTPEFGLWPARLTWRGLLLVGLALLAILRPAPAEAAEGTPRSIVNTKHNLSVSGTGTQRAANEKDICIFCHAAHTATDQTPLWNHQMSVATYTPYSSSTLKATVGQPTGSSKLCLSCHDGTVALGLMANRRAPVPMRSGAGVLPAGPSRLGTDLSGHHPISFTYDSMLASAHGEMRDPLTLQLEVRTDKNQQLQCTSCHDPHNNQYGMFLVKNNTASALCLDCHVPNEWGTSAHATSQASWNGTGLNPWPHTSGTTVAANACENCHAPHAAGTKPHLLNFAKAEDNCLVCHSGTVAAKNLASEVTKPSAHLITGTSALHDAAQSPLSAVNQRVSCVDCHSPHAARAPEKIVGSTISGALARVKGMTAAGAVVQIASREYELCFRCHADTAAGSQTGIPRQFSQPNARLQFNPANASYHPVLGAAKSVQDPTLVSGWTGARQMLCTDCHNNDQGPGANGVGPKGPHGSRYAPLLERNLAQVDFQPESVNAYALCYKCHSQGVLLADRFHSQHVRDQRAACTTCHDSHGVQTQTHLINFNTIYVKPLNGQMSYKDLGAGHSSCTLTCHGASHNNKSY
jgi:predicted CXXCH cytochrome family protein